MRELSLFTGAGGGLLGTKLLGWEHIGYVEIDDYCQRVLAQRIADGYLEEAPIFTDVREFIQSGAAEQYRGIADVVTAGFPCQFYSSAPRGRQRAEADLWAETAEVIRIVRPRYVFLENVAGAFPKGEAGVICPSWFGAPHRRPRGWLASYSNSESKSRCTVDEKMACLPSLSGRAVWKADVAGVMGVDDGMADRMDRLKALGNGQVPAVVRAAWELLK